MTAYSYQQWNGLSQEEQANNAGISITRDHPVNNPNRGVYWSGQSSATALATHVQDVLSGPNRQDAERMFRLLKLEYRKASESPKSVDNALMRRRKDADRALESTAFTLSDRQFDQLQCAADDIYRIQDHAEVMGVNPIDIANAMIDRAASAAVGFAPPRADQMRPEFREFLQSKEGIEGQENLNQSVAQLYAEIRNLNEGEEVGVAPSEEIETIMQYGLPEGRTRGDERDMLNDIVKSVPLERNPRDIAPSKNFSVRMDTIEEAKAMEVIVRWAGENENLPAPEVIHEAFNSWKDNGLVSSPFDPRPINRIGLIVGAGETADRNARDIIEGFGNDSENPTQLLVLTTGNKGIGLEQEIDGRPVVAVQAKADRDGVRIEGVEGAPDNAILMMNLPFEEAADSVKRSLAANAFVGTSYSVGYIQGNEMSPLDAQAIHLSGSMRKLTLGINSNGKQMGNVITGYEPIYQMDENGITVKDKSGSPLTEKDENGRSKRKPIYSNELQMLRTKAQQLDAAADPNRYYAAGHARPRGGVTAVVFDGARNYDAAVRRFANGKDPMGDGYSRIPKHAAILTMDNDQMATNKFLRENARDRKILYAEASRKLSFAHDVDAGFDTQKVMAREAETELNIYRTPRDERSANPKDDLVDWNSPEIKGAIIMVRGNATNNVMNGPAQETKIAQEALIDFAHTGMIFDDMQKDFHAAHLTRLALEMGKRFTVVNKEGEVVALTEARNITQKNAQSFTEITDLEVSKRFRGDMNGLGVPNNLGEHGRRNVGYSLADPVGQMTLAGLPGMTHEKAAKLAKLELTLDEVYNTKDKEVQQALYKNGMPSDTVKNLGDRKAWEKAVQRALMNENEAVALDARFVPAGDGRESTKDESRLLPEKNAGYIHGPDHKMPVMAFIGNAMRTFDGPDGKSVDPGDLVDRKQLSEAIKAATDKGYAIGATFEEGIGIAVLEEVAKIPEAKVVIATSGNPRAADPEMRMVLGKLLEQDQAQVVMPTAIAGNPYQTADGVNGTRFADMRATMQDTIAHFSDVAVVVQASASDQVLNIVDKMNSQGKPVSVMMPNDSEKASLDAYRGNLRMVRGAGRTDIESISFATVPSAQGYAEITDQDTEMKVVDGVMRGNAGTFQSARFARSDNARGGHHYKTIGWGAPARALYDGQSVERMAEDHKMGVLEPLGAYKEPTVRELERRRLDREAVHSGTKEMFSEMQKQYASQIDSDMMNRSY